MGSIGAKTPGAVAQTAWSAVSQAAGLRETADWAAVTAGPDQRQDCLRHGEPGKGSVPSIVVFVYNTGN